MLLHIEMPPGWRLLAAYPMINGTAGEPSGESVVCAAYTLPFGAGFKVYVAGRATDADPVTWTDVRASMDQDTVMGWALVAAGWGHLTESR